MPIRLDCAEEYMREHPDESESAKFQIDQNNLAFKLRQFLFVAKQVAMIAAVLWLIVILLRKFWL